MKKAILLTLLLFLLFHPESRAQTSCTPLAQAVPGVTLTCAGGTTNRTGVAYNPTFNLYYSTNAGSSGYPIETFLSTGGASVATVASGFDYRGTWWNPNTNQLEGNGYNTTGIYNHSLNGTTGYAQNGGASIFTGLAQPNSQSCGDYDYNANEMIYYNSNTIYRYSRATNALLGSYPLTGTPGGTSLNTYTVVYTGCSTMEIGVFDYANRRVMLYDKSNGSYTTNVPLPGTASNPSSYRVSYANNLFWVYNTGGYWESYQLFQGCIPPTATVSALSDTTFCQGDSVALLAGTDSTYFYQWQWNGNDIPGATDSIFVTDSSGLYTVEVSVSGGCPVISPSKTITVNALPAAMVSASGPASVCAGNAVTLMASTGTGYIYQWQLNGNDISGAINSTWAASAAGNYTVVVTDTNACSDASAAFAVGIWPLPPAALSPDGNTEFCDGGSVNLVGSGGTSYQWLESGNAVSGGTGSSLHVTTSGSYSVVATDTNGCSDTSSAQLVTVYANPVVTVTPSNDTLYATSGFASYQWLDANGSPISGETNDYFVPTATGTYSVVVTDVNGCSTQSIQILVVLLTGLEGGLEQGLKVYPVPASEELYVDMQLNQAAILTLMDLQGKVVFCQPVSPSQSRTPFRLDVRTYSAGLYLLEIQSDQEVVRRKIVIE
ncbi:MAG: T9SS type A sorting domain-containing protein [Bacteroidia bacterium]|nr:T9SS type A sorting domain-containing protein [Bacteroidia bacterium]